jgi:ribosome-associated protein
VMTVLPAAATGGTPARDGPVQVTGPGGERVGGALLPAAVGERCTVVARAAESKGGAGTVVLVMGDLLSVTEAFVVTSGSNVRQVRTIVEEVEHQVKVAGGPGPDRVEGLGDARWVLMDYGDVLVHVFLDEARAFYDLEHLWSGAPRFPWQR